MTVTFLTPPGRLADTLTPIVFTVTEGVIAVSAEFRWEDGNGLWETIYQDGRFSYAYSGSTIAGGTWTVRRSTPWPADVRVLVDEAASGGGGPNPPSSAPPPIGAVSVIGAIGAYATETHTHAHGDQAGGTLHEEATDLEAGFMSVAQVIALSQTQTDTEALAQPSYLTLAASGALENERVFAPGAGLAATDGGPGFPYTLAQNRPNSTTSATAVAPVLTDAFRSFFCQGLGTVVTIPSNATVPFPVGTVMWFVQGVNSGEPSQLSVVPAAGVTFQAPGAWSQGVRARHFGGCIEVRKSATDTWIISGYGLQGQNTIYVSVSKTADYTLGLPDADTINEVNSATAVTVTVPANASVAFPRHIRLGIYQRGAGQVILSPEAGVSIQTPPGFVAKTKGQYSTIWLTKISPSSSNTWTVEGDLETTVPYVTIGSSTALASERALSIGAGLAATDGGASSTYTIAQTRLNVASNSTAFTPSLTDAFKAYYFQQASTVVTIPLNATIAFPNGTVMWFVQGINSGEASQLSVVAEAGVSLLVPAGRQAAAIGYMSCISVRKTSTDTWIVGGDLKGYLGMAQSLAKSASFTLSLVDADLLIDINSASPVVVTIPDNATVAFPRYTTIGLMQRGAGQVQVVAVGGVTLSIPPGKTASARGQNSIIYLIKRSLVSANAWTVEGDLEDTVPYVTIGSSTALASERALTAGAGIAITDGGPGGAATINAVGRALAWTSGNRTLAATDAGAVLQCTATGAPQLTIPAEASVSLPVGFTVGVLFDVASGGPLTILTEAAVTTVTLNTPLELQPKAGATLQKVAANRWWLVLGTPTSSGGGAPASASYLTLAADSNLTSERVLSVDSKSGLTLTDGGANGSATISKTGKLFVVTGTTLALDPANFGHDWTFYTTTVGDTTILLPAQSTYPWPVGTRFRFLKKNGGAVKMSAESGATATALFVNTPLADGQDAYIPGFAPLWIRAGEWAEVTKVDVNEWYIYGVFVMPPPV